VLITSTAEIKPLAAAQNAEITDIAGLKLWVKKSEQPKCARCWHHRADVGANAKHPEVCLRCVVNVDGGGESRQFA
jgi:isoleucyl-tRNA synthetase